MGYCTPEETLTFLEEAPRFERMLVRDGIHLFKFWLSIGREMQLQRFWKRRQGPLKQWKLSPVDIEALGLWDTYSRAIEAMLAATDYGRLQISYSPVESTFGLLTERESLILWSAAFACAGG